MKFHRPTALLGAMLFPLLLSAAPRPKAIQAPIQPSEAACRAWAAQLEQTLNLGDKTFFVSTFNARSLALRILGEPRQSPAAQEKAIAELAGATAMMGTSICDSMKRGGTYKLLALRTSGTRRTALFRMLGAGGLNYHEFLLEPGPRGSVEAVDCHVALTGEWFSQTLGRLLGSVADLAQASEPGARQVTRSLHAYRVHVEKGRQDLAIKDLEGLPAALQDQAWVLLARIQCTDREKDFAGYQALIERFRQAFPNNTTAGLLSLDYFYLRKDFDAAVRTLDGLKPLLENDPYLDLLAGTTLLTKGDLEAAAARLDLAIAGDPGMKLAYQTKAMAVVKLRRYADAVAVFKALEEKFGYEVPEMARNPRYADFVKSPEYAAWKQPKD